MNGTTYYENKINRQIDYMINQNPDLPILKGYRYYIGNMALSSIYQYLMSVKNFLRQSDKDPKDLILDDYTIYMGTIKDKSSGYQISSYTALKKFSKYLKANQINLLDPMEHIDRPKPFVSIETEKKRDKGFLTKTEIKRVKNNINRGIGTEKQIAYQEKTKERDMAIFMVFMSTGIRCSALIKLDIDNVNMEKHCIEVRDKGNKTRECFLGDEAWSCLMSWIDKRKDILNGFQEDALFLSTKGGRLGRNGMTQLVKKYSKNIKDKNITPHKLRATYGTQLYNAKKDVYFVQKCMNHSSPKTTELYIRGRKNETEEGSKIMNDILTV